MRPREARKGAGYRPSPMPRWAQEYGEDHLPGAINLPLRRIEAEAASVLDPTRAIVVYCWDSA